MELLQLLRRLLQILTALHRAYESWAEGRALDNLKLQINASVDEVQKCTREQAAAFYASLDGFDALLEELADVGDLDELGDWYADYNGWRDEAWAAISGDAGTGITIMMQALDARMRHRILAHTVGLAGEIPADITVKQLRVMAEKDLAALESSEDPMVELEINRFAAEIPRCKHHRAFKYYETRKGFEAVTDALLRVNTWDELGEWLLTFHQWREKAWRSFYRRPCGVILGDMYYVESRTYLAALMHIIGEDVNQIFLELNVGLRDKEREDRATIEAAQRI